MRKRDRRIYDERVTEFLEPGEEQIERMLAGRPASFANIFFGWRVSRQVLVTDRNVYVFGLEGRERRMAGTPSKVLSKHQRGTVSVRYRVFPPTLIVAGEEIRPAGRMMIARGKPIAKAAGG